MIDLVIGGPDMSGTSTQIQNTIEFFQQRGKKVRDISGTEIDALFHADIFSVINKIHPNLKSFLQDERIFQETKTGFLYQAHLLLAGLDRGTNMDLKVASMVENDISTYIDPNAADVWVMEEPTKRGAGQVNRVIEQNRSRWGSVIDPVSAAISPILHSHRVLRTFFTLFR